MPRLITEPRLDQHDPDAERFAYGWQAPPPATPWYDGLGAQVAALVSQEARRFTDTIRADWRLLRIARCVLRILFSP